MEAGMDGDTVAPDLLRYVALYIDTPNVQVRGDGESRRYVDHDRVDWAALVSQMVSSLGVERCILTGGLYLFRSNEDTLRWHAQDLRVALGRYRETIAVVGTPRDVDSKIIIDMWAEVFALIRRWNEELPDEPCEITVLLASGDYIYADAVERMREAFAELARIRLHTFSWDKKISAALKGASEEITLLDDLQPFIRP